MRKSHRRKVRDKKWKKKIIKAGSVVTWKEIVFVNPTKEEFLEVMKGEEV